MPTCLTSLALNVERAFVSVSVDVEMQRVPYINLNLAKLTLYPPTRLRSAVRFAALVGQ